MSQFWRGSALPGVALFMETCAFYWVIVVVSIAIHLSESSLPFWVVLLTIFGAFLVSGWVQVRPFSRRLRGLIGLSASVAALIVLSILNPGPGLTSVGDLVEGDPRTVAVAVFSVLFMLIIWWRGATFAGEDITLEAVRNSFRWGLIALFVAVLADSLTQKDIVNGYLAMGYFAIGLAGLALARFSWEAEDSQMMSGTWWLPIGLSVGAVIGLALLIGALGMGGLDEFTKTALRSIADAGLLVLKPVFLAMGGLAQLLVYLANLFSGWFGGGDLTGLELSLQRLSGFHEQLAETGDGGGFPPALKAFLKIAAFVVAATAASWLLYKAFRIRRTWRDSGDVEETRESLFSWSRANRDLSALLSDWWSNLPAIGGAKRQTHSRASESQGGLPPVFGSSRPDGPSPPRVGDTEATPECVSGSSSPGAGEAHCGLVPRVPLRPNRDWRRGAGGVATRLVGDKYLCGRARRVNPPLPEVGNHLLGDALH